MYTQHIKDERKTIFQQWTKQNQTQMSPELKPATHLQALHVEPDYN